ncbi:hypothetical protein BGZ91_009142, partial [Linnemannia elongata]
LIKAENAYDFRDVDAEDLPLGSFDSLMDDDDDEFSIRLATDLSDVFREDALKKTVTTKYFINALDFF